MFFCCMMGSHLLTHGRTIATRCLCRHGGRTGSPADYQGTRSVELIVDWIKHRMESAIKDASTMVQLLPTAVRDHLFLFMRISINHGIAVAVVISFLLEQL